MVNHRKYPLFTGDLYFGVNVTQNVPNTLYIMSLMHLQSLKLLCPMVKEEMHLQENTLYDLDLGSWSHKMLPSTFHIM